MKDIKTVKPSTLDGKKLMEDVRRAGTDAKKQRPASQSVKDALLFAKRLIMVLTALSVIGLGLAAAYIGRYETTVFIKQVALIVSGLLAACDGLYLLYKALMRTE